MSLTVLATGPRALLQDAGRVGLASIGVGRSGAADRAAWALGNRLVANPPDAASVEVLLGGLRVRAERNLTVALTGAPAQAVVDGKPMGHNALIPLRAGAELALGTPDRGLRTYLAVRGGIVVDPVLGSRSTDTLSGIGPPPLEDGVLLPVGLTPADHPPADVAPVRLPEAGPAVLRFVPGPRDRRLTAPDVPVTTTWTASDRSDRIGLRLTGKPLHRTDDAELPSEGLVRGAIQLPPGGEPVLFLADHPLTGGYPVVGVVRDADVDRAAQVRPGQPVRFRQT